MRGKWMLEVGVKAAIVALVGVFVLYVALFNFWTWAINNAAQDVARAHPDLIFRASFEDGDDGLVFIQVRGESVADADQVCAQLRSDLQDRLFLEPRFGVAIVPESNGDALSSCGETTWLWWD